MADPSEPQPGEPTAATATVRIADFPARSIYRALLVRGLEPAEAANLTAYLAGLPSDGLHWTIAEVEAVVRQRAAELDQASAHPDDRAGPVQLTWQTS
ncbi:MAG TPA: hypothetical protein VFW20_03000 [Candidatus Limnocylindrales bacterium]|nr:hypothetical protein [Candidatus Limnocylindrales bacterium]